MLTPVPTMSNAERQRKFRESHPGYFRKYHARKRAMAKAVRARMLAEAQAAADAAKAARATRPLLMLPAPVELPVIPGLNSIGATPAAAAPLPVPQPAAIAA